MQSTVLVILGGGWEVLKNETDMPGMYYGLNKMCEEQKEKDSKREGGKKELSNNSFHIKKCILRPTIPL